MDVPANCDLPQRNYRLAVRARQAREVQHSQSLWRRNPELAVTRKSRIGEGKAALHHFQAVGAAERCVIEGLIVSPQSLKARGRQPVNANSAKPRVSFPCRNHVEHLEIRGDADHPVVFEPENSLVSNVHIKGAGSIFPNREGADIGEGWKSRKPVAGQLLDSTDGSGPDAAVSILLQAYGVAAWEPVGPGVVANLSLSPPAPPLPPRHPTRPPPRPHALP